ncbi:hypothetical protein CRG98_038770 [Punica granatum]|uniref:Retrovirus-related Pol polyprotein from transposon TNT 1-94 n=1 Tax=Punica granatum TaxID=22663 RepID=A0A2I0IA08_PUNGR|nr:hypothetical protein CRG98_038770 [Punica granatum]
MDIFNQIVMDLANVDVKIKDKDQALLLLCSLSKSYEDVVDTMLYERTSIILEDAKAALNLKELQKKVIGYQESDGEGLIAKDRSIEKGPRRGLSGVLKVSKGAPVVMKGELWNGLYVLQDKAGTMTAFKRSTLEKKYLGDLNLDKVDECKSMHSIQQFANKRCIEEAYETAGTFWACGVGVLRSPRVEGEVEPGRSWDKAVEREVDCAWLNASQGGDLLEMSHIKLEDPNTQKPG